MMVCQCAYEEGIALFVKNNVNIGAELTVMEGYKDYLTYILIISYGTTGYLETVIVRCV